MITALQSCWAVQAAHTTIISAEWIFHCPGHLFLLLDRVPAQNEIELCATRTQVHSYLMLR